MSATINKSKIGQNDLRKFMKESKTKSSKIDSPLAKYNSLNQLTCVVCNSILKSDSLWPAHIRGRLHKQNVERLKNPAPQKVPQKRVHEDKRDDGPPEKSIKEETFKKPKELPPDFFENSTNSNTVKNEAEPVLDTSATSSELPANFFDVGVEPLAHEAANSSTNKSENLPEGFFDDPVADAKVRKVEYKDPMDEEWDKFQKIISTESSVSEAIMDEDIEESKAERDIDEINEQMHNWSRVQVLQNKKEAISLDANKCDNDDDSSSADEQEFEEFLDWRSKRVR